jgi:acetolactate synthase I/II/III large subunit
VLLAGAGAVRCGASAALTHLAERAGLPVVVGAMAKGVISEDHSYFAGVLDMSGHRVIWDPLGSADLIVTAGFDPVELITPWRVAAPRVDSVAGLEKALSAAFSGRGRPLVIEARVDTTQYSAQF